jgi:hypothetical protein
MTRNSEQTVLSEAQTTIIVEAMKRGNGNQYDLASSLQGVETAKSRAFRIGK